MSSLTSAPQPGEVFAGKYRVERVLGRGGMGVVVAATHLALGHEVAIKCLLPSASVDAELLARFFREARVTARLKSNHVAKTIDMGQLDDGRPFLVMEILEGRDLGAILESDNAELPVEIVVQWVLQACEGIAEAHAAGIVHRDLKPSNLFLAHDASGTDIVKVLDFGISKLADDAHGTLTSSEASFGSPLYMPPEQLRSSKAADARSDVWSLGVILYEMLCKQPPFMGTSVFAIAQSVMSDAPAPAGSRRASLPRGLSDVIGRCLAKPPAERPQSVADLADLLAPFAGPAGQERAGRVRKAAGRSSSPVIVGAVEPSDGWREAATLPASRAREPVARRSTARWPWLAGAAVLAVAVAAAVAGVTIRSRTPAPRASAVDARELAGPPPTVSSAVAIASEPPVVGAAPAVATTTAPLAPASSPAPTTRRPIAKPPPRASTSAPAPSATTKPPPAPASTGPFIERREN